MNKTLKILAITLICLLVGVGIAVAFKTYIVPSTGHYKGELLIEPASIDWGNVTKDASVLRSLNLTNTGPDITSLNMTYTLNSGALYNYTLTWDQEGSSLLSGYYTVATFNLTVYDADEGDFDIDISINTS